MYVYKKKCDEDYYLSIIQSTQQQYMFKNQQNPNFVRSQGYQPYNYAYPGNYMNNTPYNNNNNYYNPYKTPESHNLKQLYNNYNNSRYNMHPTPIIDRNEDNYGYHNNGNRRHIMEDQILYNKLNSINDINNNQKIHKIQNNKNNEFQNEQNNKYINNNYHFYNNNNNHVNKKIFKLEDFLSGTKKNNLNDKFNLAANDGF